MIDPATSTISPAQLAPADGEILRFVGERVRVLADAAGTGGRLFIFEETTPPGGGPPLHRHLHDDEFFYVLEGRFRFVLDGREFVAERGAFITAPRTSLHAFCNIGNTPGRMLIQCAPAGLESRFRAAAALGDGATPEALANAFDGWVVFEGPPIGRGPN